MYFWLNIIEWNANWSCSISEQSDGGRCQRSVERYALLPIRRDAARIRNRIKLALKKEQDGWI